MKADEHQVGGSHYRSSYQHWSFVLDVGMDYLAGNATKYVARWRKKGGVEDLRKALTYLNKLEEDGHLPNWRWTYPVRVVAVARFSTVNNLSDLERAFFLALATWEQKEDLAAARMILFSLLDEAERLAREAAPVPLTEENHYTERVGESYEI